MPTRTYSVQIKDVGLDKQVKDLRDATRAWQDYHKALNGVQQDALRTTEAVGGLGRGLQGLSAAIPVAAAVAAGINAMGQSIQESLDHLVRMAEKTLALRDAARELKAIMGDKTTTQEAAHQVQDLMLKTGATSQEALKFDEMWESGIFAAKQKGNWGLNDRDTETAKTEALRFAVASKIDPATMGKMMTGIGTAEPVASVDELLGKLSAMHQMAVEGVGNFAPIMQVENKLRGQMVRPGGGGAVRSSEELMAVVGTATIESGNEAAATQSIRQAWRELSSGGNAKKAATLAKYGIKTGTDDFVTSIEKIAPLLDEARAAGKSELDALKEAGFGNASANAKIINFVQDRKILRARLDRAPKLADPARIRSINEQFAAENPDRFAKAQAEVAQMQTGEEGRGLATMRKFAEAGLENRGLVNKGGTNLGENILDMNVFGYKLNGLQESARDRQLDATVSSAILKNVPDAAERFPTLRKDRPVFGDAARGEKLAGIINQLTPEQQKKVAQDLERWAQEPLESRRKATDGQDAAGIDRGFAGAAAGAAVAGGQAQARVEAPDIREAAPMILDAAKRMQEAMASRGGGPPPDRMAGRGGYQPVMPGRV